MFLLGQYRLIMRVVFGLVISVILTCVDTQLPGYIRVLKLVMVDFNDFNFLDELFNQHTACLQFRQKN